MFPSSIESIQYNAPTIVTGAISFIKKLYQKDFSKKLYQRLGIEYSDSVDDFTIANKTVFRSESSALR